MNTKHKAQEIQEKISLVSAGINELAKQRAKLEGQAEPLTARISELEQQIKARDWTLSGHRPKGESETIKYASETRSRLYAERNNIARELSELQRQLIPMKRQIAERRCDLATLEQLATTPGSVQAEIDTVAATLAELEGERTTLMSILNVAEGQLSKIAKVECDEANAAECLTDARAKSFLATPSADTALVGVIAEAEKALDRCRDKALSARAARPTVLLKIENAKEELNSLDEQIEQQKTRLDEKQSQLRKIEAYDQWGELMPLVRQALGKMLRADSAVGRALVEALMCEGLKEFDEKRHLVRPGWLQTKASELSNM